MKQRIVVALGGNALGKNLTEQYEAVKITAKAIADLIEAGNDIIITHGNGPQVGKIDAAMNALILEDPTEEKTTLSMCVAMSQAYIGYDIQNALRKELMLPRDVQARRHHHHAGRGEQRRSRDEAPDEADRQVHDP